MRFLAIARPTTALGLLPPDVLLQLQEASFAGMQQLREERKVLEWYYSPAGCSAVILDYDDPDQWVKEQGMVPLINYMEQEVYPLANGFDAFQGMIQSMKARLG